MSKLLCPITVKLSSNETYIAVCFNIYAQLFRKGLSAAAPMLQDLGAGEALGSGVKALQSYDTVRKQVMDVDDKGRSHYDRIAQAIK